MTDATSESSNTTIEFEYINYKGVRSKRRVTVDSIEFIRTPGYDYQPGWFISGYDHDKKARRSFAMTHIVIPAETPRGVYRMPFTEKQLGV